MIRTIILVTYLLISDCGVASADMMNPPITLMLSIPVTLFFILAFILYWTLKAIMYLRANPDAAGSARSEKTQDDQEIKTVNTAESKPEKSFLETIREYYVSLFITMIVLFALSFIEHSCNRLERANRPRRPLFGTVEQDRK